MIYLASPYSGTPEQQQARFEATEAYTAKLIKKGLVVFSPIVYAHEMAKRYDLGTSADYWDKFNTEMLLRSSIVYVLTLEGWSTSKGVAREIYLAKLLKIELYYIGP